MSKKKGNVLEQHVDKLVLGFIILLSIFILWKFVIHPPYTADGFGPGKIDPANQQQAELLNTEINSPAEMNQQEDASNRISEFEQLLECSVSQISTAVSFQLPGVGDQPMEAPRVYAVPEIPDISKVEIAVIRGPAYVPTEEIRPDLPYQTAAATLQDMDFITISAEVDVQTLYRNFQQSFMNLRLNASWRDPSLATPVFARVDLQRSTLQSDGSWSTWESISLPQICSYRKLFGDLPADTDQLPSGGINLLMAQYRDILVQTEVLQPQSYDFALATLRPWLPPKYFKKYQDLLQRQRDMDRRKKLDVDKSGVGMMMEPGRGPMDRRTMMDRRSKRGPARNPRGQEFGGEFNAPAEVARPGIRQPTPEDVIKEARGEWISPPKATPHSQSDMGGIFKSRRDPLVVWAHDDTVEQDQTYQYRIRMGVFNPIAGKNWFRPDEQDYKSQVILWSNFVELKNAIKIPSMMHVFPISSIEEEPGSVKIQISKYHMGKWRSEEFSVYPGQVIGNEVELKEEEDALSPTVGMGADMGMDPMGGTATAAQMQKDQVLDYTTDLILMDVHSFVDWSGNTIRRRQYDIMMVTRDGNQVELMEIGSRNWPNDLKKEFSTVRDAEKENKNIQILGRSSGGIGGGDYMQDTYRMPEPAGPGMEFQDVF